MQMKTEENIGKVKHTKEGMGALNNTFPSLLQN